MPEKRRSERYQSIIIIYCNISFSSKVINMSVDKIYVTRERKHKMKHNIQVRLGQVRLGVQYFEAYVNGDTRVLNNTMTPNIIASLTGWHDDTIDHILDLYDVEMSKSV